MCLAQRLPSKIQSLACVISKFRAPLRHSRPKIATGRDRPHFLARPTAYCPHSRSSMLPASSLGMQAAARPARLLPRPLPHRALGPAQRQQGQRRRLTARIALPSFPGLVDAPFYGEEAPREPQAAAAAAEEAQRCRAEPAGAGTDRAEGPSTDARVLFARLKAVRALNCSPCGSAALTSFACSPGSGALPARPLPGAQHPAPAAPQSALPDLSCPPAHPAPPALQLALPFFTEPGVAGGALLKLGGLVLLTLATT